ncbi:MAG: hypothetical protein IAE86_10975 [Burkholderiaceae bacterium]|nr:hypothetical protein [Burkholderiaceae bacterium]
MTKTVPWWTLVPTVLFTALAMWVTRPVVQSPSGQLVTIEFPGGGRIEVRSKREALDHDELMTTLFSKDDSKRGVLGWLRDKQHLYSLENPELAQALSTTLCDPIPLEPLESRLAKAEECASKPSAAALRRLSQERAVPFHYVGVRVKAGVQAAKPHRPGAGRVNVCRTGKFVAQRLQIVDPVTSRVIEVQPGGTYECTVADHPDIQLDPEDAKRLFGRPPAQFESVIAVVI